MTNFPVQRHRMIIEGFGCDIIPTVEYIYNFMESLSKKIDMRILVPPVVVRVPVVSCVDELETNDFGVSAQMIWLESGCQLHTWPKHKFVALDMFSCKDFKREEVIDIFNEWFQPEDIYTLFPEIKQ